MMNEPSPASVPPDQAARDSAVVESKRNVFVTAGAGSGKTSLLVERALWLLLVETVEPDRFAAITFTELAAGEMRGRLRTAMATLTEGVAKAEGGRGDAARFAARARAHNLDLGRLTERARDVAERLDESAVTTIHAFCLRLLERRALEAGLPPSISVDDGVALRRLGEEAWPVVLRSLDMTDAGTRDALARVHLSDVRQWFFAMLEPEFEGLDWRKALGSADGGWVVDRAEALLRRIDEIEPTPNAPKAAGLRWTIRAQLEELIAAGPEGFGTSNRIEIEETPKSVKGYRDGDLEALVEARRLLNLVRQVSRARVEAVLSLLGEHAAGVRAAYRAEGWIGYEGILILTRNVLRDHVRVRAFESERLDAILVDEFQDTDPLQYEIVFYLTEERGTGPARSAWDVTLTPGKLFLVGDPKQSIYRFRGADLRAYAIAQSRVSRQGGLEVVLDSNFRSPQEILTPVDRLFYGWFGFVDGAAPSGAARPEYVAMKAFRAPPDPRFGALPRVEVVRVHMPEAWQTRSDVRAMGAREASRLAEAHWIAEEIGRAIQEDGLRAEDHAILLRAFTSLSVYTTTLDRAGIPYAVEGGKTLFERIEIKECLAWLRAVTEPNDAVAVVAALRSSAGAVPDAELARYAAATPVDKRWRAPLECDSELYPSIGRAFDILRKLREDVATWTPLELLHAVFERTRLVEIHACGFDGAQRVANLEQCLEIASALAMDSGADARALVEELEARSDEEGRDAQRSIADAGGDAVRILTIHKAKGLEFPVVFVADVARDQRHPREAKASLRVRTVDNRDAIVAAAPSSGLCSLDFLGEELDRQMQEEAEACRILYVAATRAKERLRFLLPPRTDKRAAANPWAARITRAFDDPTMERYVAQRDARLGETGSQPSPRAAPAVEAAARRVRTFAEAAAARALPTVVAASSLGARPGLDGGGKTRRRRRAGASAVPADVLGEAIHALLGRADFASGGNLLDPRAHEDVLREIALDRGVPLDGLTAAVSSLWRRFEGGALRTRVANAGILARELPILAPHPAAEPEAEPPSMFANRVCIGVADLLLEEGGRWVVADWKTDDVKSEAEIAAAVERHRAQVAFYGRALAAASSREVASEIFFVRIDRAVRL